MKKGDLNSKGFTIIEVSLVLAIAGLIFLMMFVALPGLRTSQRDNDRRADVMKFLDSVKKYQTDNRGALPGGGTQTTGAINVTVNSTGDANTWPGFYKAYLGNNFVDPSGENYKLLILNCGAQADQSCQTSSPNQMLAQIYDNPINYTMVVVKQASCYGDHAVASSNPRKLAVLYKLEGAGVYCSNT